MRESSKKFLAFIAYVNIFLLGFYLSSLQISLTKIAAFYNLNVEATGFVILLQYLGVFLPTLFLGALCGRLGKKKVLYISYILIFLGTLCVALGTNYIFFCFAMVLNGCGYAVLEATSTALLSDEYPEKSRFHINMTQLFFSIGAVIGPFIFTMLLNAGLKYKSLFLILSFLFLAAGISFTIAGRDYIEVREEQPQRRSASFIYLKTLPFILLALMQFLYAGIEEITGFYADSYFQSMAANPGVSALALSLFWAMMIPSRLLSAVVKTKTKTILLWSAFTLSISLAGAMLVLDIAAKIVLFCIAGFAAGPIWPLIMDSAVKKFPNDTGVILNFLMAMCGIGGGMLPFIAGLFVGFTDYSFYICRPLRLRYIYT